ncbi:MAG: TPM domain-containing protein, partial [Candidatus Rokubacteria bacterium]|nr:TPM domain-containing protein [Candidatus Rokubacteria bacterium]
LESLLADRERATGAQMVIAVFPSLEGESLEDFSVRLAERWRIGQKGLDNGVILLVFVQDRKLRFEIGYGLEGAVPDAVAGQIIREVLGPHFRDRRYAAGLEAAASAVYARVTSPTKPLARPAQRQPEWVSLAALALIVAVMAGLGFGAWQTSRHLRRGRRLYTAGSQGWYIPPSTGWSSGGGFGGGGGFSGGGGGFGGGGASGGW